MLCYHAVQSTWPGVSLDRRNENGEKEEKLEQEYKCKSEDCQIKVKKMF
jgi:hypothetical protein